MSDIVSFEYYSTVYMGKDAESESFPALNAHASRMIAQITRNRVSADNIDKLPAVIAEQYKNAICAQVDFFAINGLDCVNSGDTGGFTVGKVSVQGRQKSTTGGAMSAFLSPLAVQYLEQTGLMNPNVSCVDWWW